MSDNSIIAFVVSGSAFLGTVAFSLHYMATKKYFEKLAELSAEDLYKNRRRPEKLHDVACG